MLEKEAKLAEQNFVCAIDHKPLKWKDAHAGGDSSWTDTATYQPEEVYVLSTGWVWPKCLEGHLTLVSSTIGVPYLPETVGDILHIPWECVQSVYSLMMHVPVQWENEDF